VTVLAGSSSFAFAAFLVLLGILIALLVWSAFDARSIASRMTELDVQPQDYHRPAVYWLMASTSLPYALGLALFLRANIVEAFLIPTASMAPTLVPGDRILAIKLGVGSRTFAPGDLVIFRNPQNRQQIFIKRIVGLPGDTVELKGGEVFINDQPLLHEPIPTKVDKAATNENREEAFYERNRDRQYKILVDNSGENLDAPKQTVPAGAYFVLGDHRGLSRDSRQFGAVSHGEMLGVVPSIYWPADTWARFGVVK
jgi:signal peptidase I